MTDTITPEVGKTYLTRDGEKARCICTDRRDYEYPVLCLVDAGGSEAIETYTAGGHFNGDRSVAGPDLVSEAPRVVPVEVWIELAPNGKVVDLVSEAPRVVPVEVWIELAPNGKMVGINPTRYDPISPTGTIVKITQDVELPND